MRVCIEEFRTEGRILERFGRKPCMLSHERSCKLRTRTNQPFSFKDMAGVCQAECRWIVDSRAVDFKSKKQFNDAFSEVEVRLLGSLSSRGEVPAHM
jgi:hypothetical protein